MSSATTKPTQTAADTETAKLSNGPTTSTASTKFDVPVPPEHDFDDDQTVVSTDEVRYCLLCTTVPQNLAPGSGNRKQI
ncbi:hypothetical protein GYMLUDRAFT_32539 [Collybiopsis luxurians FD-317 M1]|nr:hypothetical protein GYMLUDRAFT_32539 [Collybiopsis luxurians FD-317 M1]